MIIASGYSIKDEKQFKQDIAKFIYQLRILEDKGNFVIILKVLFL